MYTKRNISISLCEKIIDQFLSHGGDVCQVADSVLGIGTVVLDGSCAGLRSFVIVERYLGNWGSIHDLQIYPDGKLPAKWLQAVADSYAAA